MAKKMILFVDAINAVTKLTKEYQKWMQSEGPNVPYNGTVTKCISEDLDTAIRKTCDAMADDRGPEGILEVDVKARPFVQVFDDIAVAFLKWIQDASMQLPSAPPRGSSDLHNAIDRLSALNKSHNHQLPPPIKQLLEVQHVSPRQVAIIYGWKTEDGSPDVQKVFEEQATPGKHYKAEEWVAPALKAAQAEFEAQWADREPRPVMFKQLEAKPQGESPKPPSLDELFAAKAPKAQIMRLHKLTDEEVEFHASERGLSLVGERFIIPANETVAHQERMAAEEKMQAMIKETAGAK